MKSGQQLIREALQCIETARPASGNRPATEAEWSALLIAHVRLAAAMYRVGGMSRRNAEMLAQQTHGGIAGRLLMEMIFNVNEAEAEHD